LLEFVSVSFLLEPPREALQVDLESASKCAGQRSGRFDDSFPIVPVLLAATVYRFRRRRLLPARCLRLRTRDRHQLCRLRLIDRPLTAEFIGCSFVGGQIGMILASRLSIARRRSTPLRRHLHRR